MVFLIRHIQWINSHSLDGLDNKENICLIRISEGSSKAYFYGKQGRSKKKKLGGAIA